MKTEEEIMEEIKIMNKCLAKDRNDYLKAETYGYILALKWVLEEE